MYDVDRNIWIENNFSEFDIRLCNSGYARLDKRWDNTHDNAPHINTYFRLYYVKDGSADIYVDKEECRIEKDHLYLIPPGTSFRYKCDDFLNKLFFHFVITGDLGYSPIINQKKPIAKPVPTQRIDKLCSLYSRNTYGSVVRLKQMIMDDVTTIMIENKIFDNETKRYSEPVEAVIRDVKENISMQLSLEEESKLLGISEYRLSKMFKNEVGKNINEYIDEMVMLEANRLILCTNMPMAAISEKLGFCDQFYFSKKYKKKFEFSPQEHRKIMRNTP